MKRVIPGSPLRIHAGDWNRLADLVDSQVTDLESQSMRSGRSQTVIEVINNGQTALPEGRFVCLGTPVLLPSNELEQFKSNPVFAIDDTLEGSVFAVLSSPANPGEIVPAVVSGGSPCLVDVSDSSHRFAVPSGGRMISAAEGPVQLAYTGGIGTDSWCFAVLGAGGGGGEGIGSGAYTGPFALYSLGELPQASLRVREGIVHAGSATVSCWTTTITPVSTGTHYVRLNVSWSGGSNTGYFTYTYDDGSTESFSYLTWQKVLGVYWVDNVVDPNTQTSSLMVTAFNQWWMGGNLEICGRVL